MSCQMGILWTFCWQRSREFSLGLTSQSLSHGRPTGRFGTLRCCLSSCWPAGSITLSLVRPCESLCQVSNICGMACSLRISTYPSWGAPVVSLETCQGLWQDLVRPFQRQSIAYSKAGKVSLGMQHWKRSHMLRNTFDLQGFCACGWDKIQLHRSLWFEILFQKVLATGIWIFDDLCWSRNCQSICFSYCLVCPRRAPPQPAKQDGRVWMEELVQKVSNSDGCCGLDKTSRRCRRQLENLWSMPRPCGEGGRLQPKARHARGQLWYSQLEV